MLMSKPIFIPYPLYRSVSSWFWDCLQGCCQEKRLKVDKGEKKKTTKHFEALYPQSIEHDTFDSSGLGPVLLLFSRWENEDSSKSSNCHIKTNSILKIITANIYGVTRSLS